MHGSGASDVGGFAREEPHVVERQLETGVVPATRSSKAGRTAPDDRADRRVPMRGPVRQRSSPARVDGGQFAGRSFLTSSSDGSTFSPGTYLWLTITPTPRLASILV